MNRSLQAVYPPALTNSSNLAASTYLAWNCWAKCLGKLSIERPLALATFDRKRPLGAAKVNLTVLSSTLVTTPGWPPAAIQLGGDAVRSLFISTSSHQNTMSSAVTGVPSDHLMPLRRWKVYSFASELASHFSATFGTMSLH